MENNISSIINFNYLPIEVKENIFCFLPLKDLVISRFVNKNFYNQGNFLLNRIPDKFAVVDALLDENCYKTALLSIKQFKLDEKAIQNRLVKKFNAKPSLDLFLLIGLLNPINSRFRPLDLKFSIRDINNFKTFFSQIGEKYLKRLENFFSIIDHFGMDFDSASLLYYAKKALYDQKIITELKLGHNTISTLSKKCLDLSVFLDFLLTTYERLTLKFQEDIKTSTIFKLAKNNSLIVFLELASNQKYSSLLELERVFNDSDFIYNFFISYVSGANLEEYFSNISKLKNDQNLKLIKILNLFRSECCKYINKEDELKSVKWILSLQPANTCPSDYFSCVLQVMNKYNSFLEWSHLLLSIPLKAKETVVTSIIKLYLQKETLQGFCNALYCLRELKHSNSYSLYQEKAIKNLCIHDEKWQLDQMELSNILIEDFGELILYVLKKELVEIAEKICKYLDRINEEEDQKRFYISMIQVTKTELQKEQININFLLNEKQIIKDPLSFVEEEIFSWNDEEVAEKQKEEKLLIIDHDEEELITNLDEYYSGVNNDSTSSDSEDEECSD